MESGREARRRPARDSLRATPDRPAPPLSSFAAGAANRNAYRARTSNARSTNRALGLLSACTLRRRRRRDIPGQRFHQPALPRLRQHHHQRVQQPQDHPLHQPNQPLPRLLRRPQVAELLEGGGEAVGQVLCSGGIHRTQQEHGLKPPVKEKLLSHRKNSSWPAATRTRGMVEFPGEFHHRRATNRADRARLETRPPAG